MIKEPKICPECKCKTVQTLKDRTEYCTREKCVYSKKHKNKTNKMDPESKEMLAGILYEVYCKSVGGIAWNGDPLPSWNEFSKDETKKKQADGWRDVAEASREN